MQKDLESRYESVEAFAKDIRRHLDHRPILARPDSLFYQTGKFVRRNRVAVAFGALDAGAMITSTIVVDVGRSIRELPDSLSAR